MGGIESKEDIWRKSELKWDKEDKQKLLEKIKSKAESVTFSSGMSQEYFRIIFVGPVGSGKSSVINAFNTALNGSVDNRAIEEYEAYDPESNKMNFRFCDVKGTGTASAGSINCDIFQAILGKKKVGEEFQPGHTSEIPITVKDIDHKAAYMVVYVMDAAAHVNRKAASGVDPYLEQVLSLKEKTDKLPIGRALILTHMDVIVPELLQDISKIHSNTKVKSFFNDIIERTKFPKRCVFPVVNPVGCVDEIPDEFSVHLLYTLYAIVKDASDMCKHRSFLYDRFAEN